MPVRKVTKQQWDFEVRRAYVLRELNKKKFSKARFAYYNHIIDQYVPIPYILGGIAIMAMFFIYGPKEFFKFFLNWVISLTIVTAAAHILWKKYERRIAR